MGRKATKDMRIDHSINLLINDFIDSLQEIIFTCKQAMMEITSGPKNQAEDNLGNSPTCSEETQISIECNNVTVSLIDEVHQDTLLHNTLESMLRSGRWDDSLTLLPLTPVDGKSAWGRTEIIERDAYELINFLEKIIWERNPSIVQGWLGSEDIAVLKDGGIPPFLINQPEAFSFTMRKTIDMLLKTAETARSGFITHLAKAGSKGGKQSKINQPILKALIQFIEENPRCLSHSNEQIIRKFEKTYQSYSPAVITVNGMKYKIYCDKIKKKKRYISGPCTDSGNFLNEKVKSISYNTFKNSYLPRARKEVKINKS